MADHIYMGHVRMRYVVPAALLSAAVAFGASALDYAAVAAAEPGTWDVGAYDQCAADASKHNGNDPEVYQQLLKLCCMDSDGVWDYAHNKCVAPPATAPGSRQIPSDIATAPVATPQPSVRITPERFPGDLPAVTTVAPPPVG